VFEEAKGEERLIPFSAISYVLTTGITEEDIVRPSGLAVPATPSVQDLLRG
jgi:hypothetical protein